MFAPQAGHRARSDTATKGDVAVSSAEPVRHSIALFVENFDSLRRSSFGSNACKYSCETTTSSRLFEF